MKKNITIIIIIIFSLNTKAQQNNAQGAFYNIGLGAITGSVGAAFNKKPNEKLGKVMLKGFWQGALGGTVVYGSKQMVYNFNKNDNLNKLWMAKVVNSFGVSAIENASLNTNFYDKWHIHIGFNRLELDIKNNYKFRYKVLPAALYGTIYSSNKAKFDLKYSLQTLTPIFTTEKKDRPVAIVNSIITRKRYGVVRSLAHEFMHTLQYDDYTAINVFFDKQRTEWGTKNKFIKKYNNLIFMDLPGGITLRSFYLLENINKNCHYDNYFENEANFYSDKRKCW